MDEIRKIICRGIGVVGPEKRWGRIATEKKKGSKMMRKNHTGAGFHTDEAEAKDQGEGER